ncbi:MAG TPA: hypothetical protein VGQ62_03370 [Chloroflexota bacterium]|jgi:hypothetical protein|nr:hypothetical protein [Chloroflexota bacterium]
MFETRWSWVTPLVGATAVFVAVLLTTPPGVRAISDVLLGSVRGANADAAAYALGAAGSLALLALLGLAVVCGVVEITWRRWR